MRNKKKKQPFEFIRKVMSSLSPAMKTLKVREKRFNVYDCGGEHKVVYRKGKVVFNSAIDEETYGEWLKKIKR